MRTFSSHLVSSNAADGGGTLAAPRPGVPLYIAANTLSGSFSSPAINLMHIYGYSVTAVTSGVSGSLSLWCSNDPGNDFYGTGVTNWTQIAGTSATVSGSSNTTWNLQQQFYKWAQLQYSQVAGTGSIDVFMSGKGNAQ